MTAPHAPHRRHRQTRQRQAVLEVLQATRSHPDAAWVHGEVRATLPSISLGTVYRTLDALVRDGVLLTIERAGQATRYDYKRGAHTHHHAVCRSCGSIHDIEVTPPSLPATGLPSGFAVQDVRLEYHGLCGSCQTRQR